MKENKLKRINWKRFQDICWTFIYIYSFFKLIYIVGFSIVHEKENKKFWKSKKIRSE